MKGMSRSGCNEGSFLKNNLGFEIMHVYAGPEDETEKKKLIIENG